MSRFNFDRTKKPLTKLMIRGLYMVYENLLSHYAVHGIIPYGICDI